MAFSQEIGSANSATKWHLNSVEKKKTVFESILLNAKLTLTVLRARIIWFSISTLL